MVYTKKGAMFGLDARIALAIFGALSIISGAALYSAIQDSKVTALLTEMDNIGKATTAYYLDTGVYPANVAGAADTSLNAAQLVTSGPAGWQGPYVSFTDSGRELLHNLYGNISLNAVSTGNFADLTLNSSKCVKGATPSAACAVYVCMDDIPAEVSIALNEKVDGVEGSNGANNATHGKYRYNGTVGCFNVMTYPVSNAGHTN